MKEKKTSAIFGSISLASLLFIAFLWIYASCQSDLESVAPGFLAMFLGFFFLPLSFIFSILTFVPCRKIRQQGKCFPWDIVSVSAIGIFFTVFRYGLIFSMIGG